MNIENLEKLFSIVVEDIPESVNWRLEGSTNLLVQRMDVSVGDLDIATDEKGLIFFREKLKEYIVKDWYKEKINSDVIVCEILGEEVEILCYHDLRLRMFSHVKPISWNNHELKVLPLDFARKFYEFIDYKDKVNLINNFLEK